MRAISESELAVLVDELAQLHGFRVDNFYETGTDTFRIRLVRSGEKRELRCYLPYFINITDYTDKATEPTPFAMGVRKRIVGATITQISQLGNDRIVKIELRKIDQNPVMIIELFGRGNIVITDVDMKIQIAYRVHRFKDREVVARAQYVAPAKHSVQKNHSEYVQHGAFEYIKGSRVVDFSLVPSGKYADMETKHVETLGKALDDLYVSNLEQATQPRSKEMERAQKSLKKQLEIVSSIDDEADAAKKAAEKIFANLEPINRAISAARKKHATGQDVQTASGKDIIDISHKDKTITMEV